MAYKIVNEELDVVIQEWMIEWHEPMSMEEISTGMRVDALDEPIQEGKSIHDSDGESSTESDPEAQRILEEA